MIRQTLGYGVPGQQRRHRAGVTLMELTAAAAMLGMLLASSVQVLRTFSHQQRAADRQGVALQTVQNLMEELTNRRWDELTPGDVTGLRVPDAVASYLPGAEIMATATDEPEPVESRRITIALTWDTPSGQRGGPVQLTAWAFQQ